MSHYYARARRNTGSWLTSIVNDHATHLEHVPESEEGLHEFVELARKSGLPVIAVDSPAPVRGYAVVLGSKETGKTAVRLHVLENQPDAVYTALYSAILVQARQRLGGFTQQEPEIHVDMGALAPHVQEHLELRGKRFNLILNGDNLESPQVDEEAPETPLETAPSSPDEEDDTDIFVEREEGDTTQLWEGSQEASESVLEESEQEEEGFKCLDCDRVFTTPQGLGAHSRTHA